MLAAQWCQNYLVKQHSLLNSHITVHCILTFIQRPRFCCAFFSLLAIILIFLIITNLTLIMSDVKEKDRDLMYPAIDRALKLLSSRLGVEKATKRCMNVNDTVPDDIVNIPIIESGVRLSTAQNIHNQSYILDLIHNRTSEVQVSGQRDFLGNSDEIPANLPSSAKSIWKPNEHDFSQLSRVRMLARLQLARKNGQEPSIAGITRIGITASSPTLETKTMMLRRALRWCSEWRVKGAIFARLQRHAMGRGTIKRTLAAAAVRLFNKTNFERVFSSGMKSCCINRFGKGRVAQLYCVWRVKRKYFKQWLLQASTSAIARSSWY